MKSYLLKMESQIDKSMAAKSNQAFCFENKNKVYFECMLAMLNDKSSKDSMYEYKLCI